MKLPIVSRKKYEMLKKNNKALNDARLEVSKAYQESQKTNDKLSEENRTLGNCYDLVSLELKEAKKEIANLKRLLTKNHIEYKKAKEKKQC